MTKGGMVIHYSPDARIAATTTFPDQIEVMGPGAWKELEERIEQAKEKALASAA